MNKEKPEAHRLAEELRDVINLLECDFSDDIDPNDLKLAAMELESLHARVQELETKEAKPAAPVAMPEPVAAQVRFKPENNTAWSSWKVCAVGYAREIEAYTLVNGWGYEVRYLHAEQQVRALLATPNNLPAQAITEKAAKYDHLLPYLCKTCGGYGLLDRRSNDDPLGSEPCPDCNAAPRPQADALDAERLEWLVGEGNAVVQAGSFGFWVCWIDGENSARDEYQLGEYPTAREAIDAAIAAAKENK